MRAGRCNEVLSATVVAHDRGAYDTAAAQQPFRFSSVFRPLWGAFFPPASSPVSAIATAIADRKLMNTAISALTRIARNIRRAITRLVTRLTRRGKVKVSISVSVPPILKLVFDYRADLRAASNDNCPGIRPHHSA